MKIYEDMRLQQDKVFCSFGLACFFQSLESGSLWLYQIFLSPFGNIVSHANKNLLSEVTCRFCKVWPPRHLGCLSSYLCELVVVVGGGDKELLTAVISVDFTAVSLF